jgi:beta-amyrin synthase
MWRLKIAEGGNDPHIYSKNNFLGRQIWEFDPDAGTLEERAEVEEARQNFWRNRNEVKPSSDLLWKFQVYIHTYKFTEYVFIYIYVSMFSYFQK